MYFLRKTVRWSNEAEISVKEQKRTEEIMLLLYPVLQLHFFLYLFCPWLMPWYLCADTENGDLCLSDGRTSPPLQDAWLTHWSFGSSLMCNKSVLIWIPGYTMLSTVIPLRSGLCPWVCSTQGMFSDTPVGCSLNAFFLANYTFWLTEQCQQV